MIRLQKFLKSEAWIEVGVFFLPLIPSHHWHLTFLCLLPKKKVISPIHDIKSFYCRNHDLSWFHPESCLLCWVDGDQQPNLHPASSSLPSADEWGENRQKVRILVDQDKGCLIGIGKAKAVHIGKAKRVHSLLHIGRQMSSHVLGSRASLHANRCLGQTPWPQTFPTSSSFPWAFYCWAWHYMLRNTPWPVCISCPSCLPPQPPVHHPHSYCGRWEKETLDTMHALFSNKQNVGRLSTLF